MAQSIFIPKAPTLSDLSALDYFVPDDAVFPAGTPCTPSSLNQHPLVTFPNTANGGIFFQGVMGQDYGGFSITVDIFWVSPVIIGSVIWFVAWERDDQLPFGANLSADSYAPDKSVLSAAPFAVGDIQKATVVFSAAEADNIVGGNPYRLRILRKPSSLFDTLIGDAQIFRVATKGIP